MQKQIQKKATTLVLILIMLMSFFSMTAMTYGYEVELYTEDESKLQDLLLRLDAIESLDAHFGDYESLNAASVLGGTPRISPGGQFVQVQNGSLLVDGEAARNVDYTVSFSYNNTWRTLSVLHQEGQWYAPTEISFLLGVGAIRDHMGEVFSNVAAVQVRHAYFRCSVYWTPGFVAELFTMVFDLDAGRWITAFELLEPKCNVHVPVTPSTASVQRGTTRQFTAQVLDFRGFNAWQTGRTWTVFGNNSAGTSINSNGLLTVASNETANNILVVARTTRQNTHPQLVETIGISEVRITAAPPAPVSTPAALQNAINSAPANVQTTIPIGDDFAITNPITVPANRHITIASNSVNMRTLTQTTDGQRHFVVQGRLTLGQNITLSGGLANMLQVSAFESAELHEYEGYMLSRAGSRAKARSLEGDNSALSEVLGASPLSGAVASGGILVGPGGFFTMNAGSVLEDNMNSFGGAISLFGSGNVAAGRATFNMNGGTIRNNIALAGGAVDLYGNSRMNMTNGTIYNNQVFEDGGAIWVGTDCTANGQGFNMTGGSILNNFAIIDGGAIFSTAFMSGYCNLFTGANTVFSGNLSRGWVMPPPLANRPANINSASASVAGYILNNFDINYWGQLG